MTSNTRRTPIVRFVILALIVALMAVTAPAPAQASVSTVTSGADSGPGSFRAAVEAANADPSINRIRFDEQLTVDLVTTVTYTGTQDLTIDGAGSTVSGDGAPKAPTWNQALLVSNTAAGLTLRDIRFVDSFGNGVAVFIPGDATGTVEVALHRVTIDSATYHGLLVDGQAFDGFNTDDIPHPDCSDPWFYDSEASIRLTMSASTVTNNGQLPAGYDLGLVVVEVPGEPGTDGLSGCPADFDGVRVDDGGAGGIEARITNSVVNGNLADGLEYDETGEGDVISTISGSSFNHNGDTSAYSNALDATDFDDGFDIDEAGPGSIVASFIGSEALANFDEGFDLDEADHGDVHVTATRIRSNGNEDEGLKIDEEDDGDIRVNLVGSEVNGTASQQGIELSEESAGDLEARIVNSQVKDNDNDGINAGQEAPGSGSLFVVNSDLSGNGGDGPTDVDGVTVTLINVTS